jgi:hypothetical protein
MAQAFRASHQATKRLKMQDTSSFTNIKEENQEQMSDQFISPPIVESTIAASEVTGAQAPEEPDIAKHPTVPLASAKRYFQVNWWSIIALVLLLILAGEHTIPLLIPVVDRYLHPKARVTLFPANKQVTQTYTFLVVTGTADQSKNQIPSRLISFTTPSKSETIITTGIGYTPAIQAHGTITLYNEAPYHQTIYAGTVITAGDGIQVVTDQTVAIAAGNGEANGNAQALAHTIQAGTNANIPPLAINTLCCLSGILAKNMSPFSDGANPKPYSMLSQADLKREATYLAGTLTPLAKVGIQSQTRDFEQNLVPMQCSVYTTSNPNVGERATTATVSVSETCIAQVYDYSEVASLTRSAFSKDAQSQAGSYFVQSGSLTVAQRKTTLLDKMHDTYELSVSATGTLTFHLTSPQVQTLKKSIAGKPTAQAQQELLRLSGVAGVYIQPAHQDDTSLPADPDQIQMIVGS